MSEEKYIRVEELQKRLSGFVKQSNDSDFAPDPQWNDAVDIMLEQCNTYTPADILAGMWVPVTERLPRPCEEVLVFTSEFGVCVDYIPDVGAEFAYGGVTHWMPLPQPPEEVKHGD